MSYANSRNEDFSQKPESGFFQRGVDAIKGEINRYKDRLSNPLSYTRDLENGRDAEGLVFIDGRQVPGIFQGFRISGGVVTERFDRQRIRKMELDRVEENKKRGEAGLKLLPTSVLEDLPKGTSLFQIDKGVKAISGSAEFMLLDDDYSTAFQKTREFVRLMTYYDDGEDVVRGLIRVHTISSYLIGENAPFNFSKIKIPSYDVEMDNVLEGSMRATFEFQQFEIFKEQFLAKRPKSDKNGDDAGNQIAVLTEDENPVAQTITVN